MINTTDIYKISSFVNDIQRKYMDDVSEETLTMSTYGYMSEVFSNSIQNSIIKASEMGNEAFPIRAKFEKSILTNAITYNIDNINAIPSNMTVMLGFVEKDLLSLMEDNRFVVDKDNSLFIGDYEFHLDYDIIITKNDLKDENKVYSAMYDMQIPNQLSDIINPYLQTPVKLMVNYSNFIFITCSIRQITYQVVYKKVISNNILENKTFDFEFNNQLADFTVITKDRNKVRYLTPIFEGMPINGISDYCFYNYIDRDTIRIKFDRNSYEPKVNTDIEILIQNTLGYKGNFTYKDDVLLTLRSDKYNYSNINALIKPIHSSSNGLDRKSIEDLKEIIPKEILSRGNITNNKDLENYFNMIDANNRIVFHRRRDNQVERLYYAYILIKDIDDNIIPTNTINIKINEADLNYANNRFLLNPGNIIEYDGDTGYINNDILDDDIYDKESKGFIYSSPFIMVVNKYPLSISYYLDVIDRNYDFKYTYINKESDIQFISNYINCYKNYLSGDKYIFNLNITQNMNIDKGLIEEDSNGNIISSKITPVLIVNENNFKYYKYGKIVSYDKLSYNYTVEFELEPLGTIDEDNKIKIKDLIPQGANEPSDIYLSSDIDVSVSIYVDNDTEEISILNENDNIIPNIGDKILVNRYDSLSQISLFYNYSHIINSKVKVGKNKDGYTFDIQGVPLVRYSYINNIDKCIEFTDYIQFRKVYIDNALNTLENSFNVDLKYFNTYGPSKMFKIGHDDDILNKVNLTFNFRVKMLVGADKYTEDYIKRDIKEYVENINNITDIHISNLVTYLSNKFITNIEFIEFIGVNDYNSLYQYIKKLEVDLIEDVPEFVNINLTKDFTPDINIMLV